jgi:hypothetical protein
LNHCDFGLAILDFGLAELDYGGASKPILGEIDVWSLDFESNPKSKIQNLKFSRP